MENLPAELPVPITPNPFTVWENNRHQVTALSTRLHGACKRFAEETKNILKCPDFRTNVEWYPAPEQRMTYTRPNREAMQEAFQRLVRWFLDELAEAWFEQIVQRMGYRGQPAISALKERMEESRPLVREHNWNWGCAHLKLQCNGETYAEIFDFRLANKLSEMESLWPPDVMTAVLSRDSKAAREKHRTAWFNEQLMKNNMQRKHIISPTSNPLRKYLKGESTSHLHTIRRALAETFNVLFSEVPE